MMFHTCKTKAEVNTLFKRLAKYLHPDHGGENDLMILLTEAKEKALSGLGGYSGLSSEDILGDAYKKAYRRYEEEESWFRESTSGERFYRSKPHGQKYNSTIGNVHREHPYSGIIDDILAAAKKNPRIKTHLAERAKSTMEMKGYISAEEYNELVMYYRHKKVDQYV